ncbi:CAP domain-containing protein [Lasiosphaeria miniovina]|uniref:CAP domain-containing protein n=1 Tax=Lasiosphaeria miniovina TaxID=1954250 RepID=A0AA40AKC5_9PEZI|nr:CAP domain-containing protein [Lasiosphaeria miniovina]KAK0717360.1 CAP domain-containing protein [Lasiosphaeria miniovina]
MKSSIFIAASGAILAAASPMLERRRLFVETEVVVQFVTVTVSGGSTIAANQAKVVPPATSIPIPVPTPAPVVVAPAAPLASSPPPPPPPPSPSPSPPPAPVAPVVVKPSLSPSPAPAASPQVAAAAAPANDYQAIALQNHNVHRSNHSAGDLTWGDSYAGFAQQLASKCVFKHDLEIGGGGYGQNLAMVARSNSPEEIGPNNAVGQAASNFWYNGEFNSFVEYGSPSPNQDTFKDWGHFSQVVWKGTQQVGCASQFCPAGTIVKTMGSWFTVCNYFPQGNVGGSFDKNVLRPLGRPTVTFQES